MLSREKELGLPLCKTCGRNPKILYTKKCYGLRGIKQIAVVCDSRKCQKPEWFVKEKLAIGTWIDKNKE